MVTETVDFWRRSKRLTVGICLLVIVISSVVLWLYVPRVSRIAIFDLPLAGSAAQAWGVLHQSGLDEPVEAVRNAISENWLVSFFYVMAIILATIGLSLFVSKTARQLAWAAIPGAVLAGLCDLAGNIVLLKSLDQLGNRSADLQGYGQWRVDATQAYGPWRVAATLATFKFCLLAVVLLVVMVALFTVFKRFFTSSAGSIAKTADRILVPWRTIDADGRNWPKVPSTLASEVKARVNQERARHLYGRLIPRSAVLERPTSEQAPPSSASTPPTRPDCCAVGFCVSGGGIRSGSFTLGILQVLREQLREARYLVSVSGGGYLVGAMQLALTPQTGEGPTTPSADVAPSNVYGEGSMEEDHTRRHGNYLADGAGQWFIALWNVLRGVAGSVVVITLTMMTLGLLLSHFYDLLPFIDRDSLEKALRGTQVRSPNYPVPSVATNHILAVVLAAALLWLFSLGLKFTSRPLAIFLHTASAGILVASAVVALFIYALPAVMWVSTQGVLQGGALDDNQRVGAAGGGILFITYIGALVSILGRGGKAVGGLISRLRGLLGDAATAAGKPTVPGNVVQRLVVWAVLLILLALNLMVVGVSAVVEWDARLQIAIPVALLLIWWAVDQTWMSLHPFYRKRLASAFAVRRVVLDGGDIAARPYHFERETTHLAAYGKPVKGFPQVIFACAANLSGADRTAPGRRAVSYTLSYDYIGGTDVGWIPTDLAQDTVSGALREDLTVQAAMAISGASFASAMGTQSKAFQKILAISNARLGTWLPNPAYFQELAQPKRPWWLPGFPQIRRLTYFFREILGIYPQDNRLLFVTDGGHYDNLGLIELLRHRCRTIYCIDSGGDPPPFPQSLSEAITQARAELGVKITFDKEDINALLVGSGKLPDYPSAFEPILPRLSASSVAIGTIKYPEPFMLDGEDAESELGKIIFAKSRISPDMSAELFAYCAADPNFPRDPTSDQWFSGAQFNAYQGLGHDVGRQVLNVLKGQEEVKKKKKTACRKVQQQ